MTKQAHFGDFYVKNDKTMVPFHDVKKGLMTKIRCTLDEGGVNPYVELSTFDKFRPQSKQARFRILRPK